MFEVSNLLDREPKDGDGVFRDGMFKAALISPCGKYRYELYRLWKAYAPVWNFIMLNPSTADATLDDPTIRRCMNRAKLGGAGGIIVTNLFAYRATDPKELYKLNPEEAIGPENDKYLDANAYISHKTICAWGNHGGLYDRDEQVVDLLPEKLYRIGSLTKAGFPRHPLYLKESEPLVDMFD